MYFVCALLEQDGGNGRVQNIVSLLSQFCRTFFMDSFCFGSCNVALLCDNLIIENLRKQMFRVLVRRNICFCFPV